MTPKPSRPMRLAGIYLLFSIVWILGSDLLLQALIADPATLAQLQTLKGLLFVALSGLLILLLCRQDERNQQRLELDLRDQLLKLGMIPKTMTQPEIQAFVQSERQKWTKVIKDAKIQID